MYCGFLVPFSLRVKLRGHMSTYDTILRNINHTVESHKADIIGPKKSVRFIEMLAL